jgi:predicted MFS family arabinose efflux permease
VRGNPEGWGSTLILAFLIGAGVLLVLFVLVEARVRHPMFDLGLFRVPTFTGASIVAFALSASLFSLFLYITLYIQNSLGYSPLEAGLRFLPLSLISFFVAPIAGRLSSRVPIKALMGTGMLLVGLALLLMRGLTASSGWTALLAGFVVAGVGVGLVNAPLASTAVSVVPPQRAGMGSGINSTFRQVGIATGTAGLGALFQHLLASRAEGPLAQVPAEALAQGRPPIPGPALRHEYLALFTGALNDLFLVAAVIAFAGGVLAFALIRQRDFIASHAAAPAAPAAAEAEAEAA